MRSRILLSVVLMLVAQACGDSTSAPVPSTVVVTPGDVTMDAQGLTQQFSAQVQDKKGRVLSDIPVTWSSSNPDVATVTPQGLATGISSGTASIRASADAAGISGSATLKVQPVPASLDLVVGDGQTGAILQALQDRPTVEVQDSRGNPIAGVSVTFSVLAGAGTASPTVTTTDQDGRASTTWTLGCSDDDPQRLAARVSSLSVEFEAQADLSLPAICLASVPDGRMTFPYSTRLEAVGGDQGTLEWSVSAGTLPTGLSLAPDGTLAGTPESAGPYVFEARVQDGMGQWAAREFGLRICDAPLDLAVGGSQVLSPAGTSECGLFLPSGTNGDRYRVGFVYASPVIDSVGNPTVTFSLTRESGQVASPRLSAFRVTEPALPTGDQQDWVEKLPEEFMESVERTEAARPDHLRRLEEGWALATGLIRQGARLLPNRRALTRAPGQPGLPLAAAPDKISLRPNPGGTCDAPASVTAVKILEDDRLVLYQDSTQNASNAVTTGHAQTMFDYYRDYGESIINTYSGEVTDVNDDGRVVIFVTPMVELPTAAWVWPGDFFSTSSCAASNEMEIMYLNLEIVQSMDDGVFNAPGVVVHEMQHVSATYRGLGRFSVFGDASETAQPLFIGEGSAEIANEMASRAAWAAVGGPAVGAMVDREDIRNQGFNNEGKVKLEAWTIFGNLVRTLRYLNSQPNAVVVVPLGASEGHSPYGSGWHFLRWLGNAYGNGGPFGDAALFLEQADSLTRSGVRGVETVTGEPWRNLLEEYLRAIMLVGTGAPQGDKAFTTYDFPAAMQGFTFTGKPSGNYPWPVNVSGDTPSASFSTSVNSGIVGRSGIRILDLTSDGTGIGVEIRVQFTRPEGRIVVVRIE